MNFGRKGYSYFLIPGVVLLILVVFLPFGMNLFISCTKWNGVGLPQWVGFSNYRKAITDTVFWASFKNNIIMILAVTVIPTILGLLLAVFLFDFGIPHFGQKNIAIIRSAIYLPQILPVAIAGIVWGWILDPTYGALNMILRTIGLDNLTRNWLGDPTSALPSVMGIMVWFQIGYPLVICMSALQRIDPQILEAAQIDGAGWLRRFFISIFIIRPEILVVVLTTTIYALKLFAQIYVLTRGGPGTATLVPSYFAYQNFFEKANVGYGAAISSIMTAIIFILTAIFISVQMKHEGVGEY
ncbi:binding-protein-dependent transport systems inner membrane component [Gracilinema caldarium DSM 7334]|uniref:Binding-protein-dependent transport systems inner membrane component n=2 Tax=Gracilinema caldarium TaxID=215591 RepID=F8EYU5_GRAC1|nr:binding-protein-dependent transport systems inner membrane component [Gracilinema caldarium DSM 7334]